MKNEKIIIERFNIDNYAEYKQNLSSVCVPSEFYTLSRQTFDLAKKNVFLMFRKYESRILFFKKQKTNLIGYCIVEDIRYLPEDCQDYLEAGYQIPLSVLKEYPTVISDCMIAKKYRRKGYGRRLAEYVINIVYSNSKISLKADGDGLYFWDKLGVESVKDNDSVKILKGENRNA